MGAAAVPAVLGGAGLITGLMEGDKNRKMANRQMDQQKQLLDRKTKLFDVLFNNAQMLDQSGFFDEGKWMKQLEDESAKYEARDAGNSVGALATMGYKPGDTAVSDALVRTKLLYKDTLDNKKMALKRQLAFDKPAMYGTANGALLDQGVAAAGQNAQMYQARIGNPAGMLGAMMPFFGQMGGPGGAGQYGFLTNAVNRGALTPPDANNPFFR